MGNTINVNDGKGLYDNEGLIDTLITDCNKLPKTLIDNQFVLFGLTLAHMVQKLQNLKDAMKKERDVMEAEIADLRRQCDDFAEKVYGVPVDRENK